MTVFELGFFVGLLVAILLASKWVGGLLGISIWFVAIPLAIGAFFVLRWLGGLAMGRRANPWPVEKGKKREDK